MLSRIIYVLFLIPIGIVLISLSVANRHDTPLSLDVFNPGNPALTYHAPFFVWMFGAVATGILIGGIGMWISQYRHRKLAKQHKKESDKLRHEIKDTKQKAGIPDQTPGQSLIMKPQG